MTNRHKICIMRKQLTKTHIF